MKQKDMVEFVAEGLGVSKAKADDVLAGLFHRIADEAACGARIELPQLGSLTRTVQKGGKARNLRTGEIMDRQPALKLKFKASVHMKRRLAEQPMPMAAE